MASEFEFEHQWQTSIDQLSDTLDIENDFDAFFFSAMYLTNSLDDKRKLYKNHNLFVQKEV